MTLLLGQPLRASLGVQDKKNLYVANFTQTQISPEPKRLGCGEIYDICVLVTFKRH